MFRGKESSNRIELSRLVQDLLNLVFWAPAALGVGGWGWRVVGGWGWRVVGGWGWWVVGGTPHTCAHACARTHMHAW